MNIVRGIESLGTSAAELNPAGGGSDLRISRELKGNNLDADLNQKVGPTFFTSRSTRRR